MAGPHIKSRLESPELTTRQPEAVQIRLRNCLASDPHHIVPDETGEHVRAIQEALAIIRQRRPDLQLPQITDPPGSYLDTTAKAVKAYKDANKIVRPGQKLDDIVGRMTITQIDDDLMRGVQPKPKPPAPPPPQPVIGSAGLQIGPLDGRDRFVVEYYSKCGLETIGPGQVATGGLRRYSTFEELIDVLLARNEFHQVIVNHGDPDRGLLVPCAKETSVRETALVIGDLSGLADILQKHDIDPARPSAIEKVLLDGAARDMRVTRSVVLRIARKLVELRKKQFIVHIRACNMVDPVLAEKYRKAFGARLLTFHPSRLLFLRFILDQVKPGVHVSQFSDHSNAKSRVRFFDDPIGVLSSMMLVVSDIDGHSRVEQVSFIDHRDAGQVQGWARFLLREWRDAAPDGFVVPIMWQNEKDIPEVAGQKTFTFHCPLELGWRKLLRSVPPLVTA